MSFDFKFILRHMKFRSLKHVDSGQSAKSLEMADMFIYCVMK